MHSLTDLGNNICRDAPQRRTRPTLTPTANISISQDNRTLGLDLVLHDMVNDALRVSPTTTSWLGCRQQVIQLVLLILLMLAHSCVPIQQVDTLGLDRIAYLLDLT